MINIEKEKIDKLLKKFYDATIEQDEIDVLCNYFLCERNIPEEWKADAIILKSIGVNRYCYRYKDEFEEFLARYEMKIRKEKKKQRYNIFARYSISVAVIICLLFVVNIVFVKQNPTPNYERLEMAVADIPAPYIDWLNDGGMVYCNDGCDGLTALDEMCRNFSKPEIA